MALYAQRIVRLLIVVKAFLLWWRRQLDGCPTVESTTPAAHRRIVPADYQATGTLIKREYCKPGEPSAWLLLCGEQCQGNQRVPRT